MPTIVTTSIGATARDHVDFNAWEADTDNVLTSTDEVQRGEIHDDAEFTAGAIIAGATVDSTRYRELFVFAGDEYDIVADTGVIIRAATGAFSSTIETRESFARVSHFAIEQTGSGNDGGCLAARSFGAGTDEGILIDSMFCFSTSVGTGSAGFIRESNVEADFFNCVALGNEGASTAGLERGFSLGGANGDTVRIRNCVAFGIDRTTGTCEGFQSTLQNSLSYVNCISMGSLTVDFEYHNNNTSDNCCSEDATADDTGGSGHLLSQTVGDIFEDVSSNDFHLADDSNAIDAGLDQSAIFTEDFDNDAHGQGIAWDMGAYNFTTFGQRWQSRLRAHEPYRKPLRTFA